MNGSILDEVKQATPDVEVDDSSFDVEIKMHINAALTRLNTLGVGVATYVTDNSKRWSDFFNATSDNRLGMAKDYVNLYVATHFNPSSSGVLSSTRKEQLNELTWILNHLSAMKED